MIKLISLFMINIISLLFMIKFLIPLEYT